MRILIFLLFGTFEISKNRNNLHLEDVLIVAGFILQINFICDPHIMLLSDLIVVICLKLSVRDVMELTEDHKLVNNLGRV